MLLDPKNNIRADVNYDEFLCDPETFDPKKNKAQALRRMVMRGLPIPATGATPGDATRGEPSKARAFFIVLCFGV